MQKEKEVLNNKSIGAYTIEKKICQRGLNAVYKLKYVSKLKSDKDNNATQQQLKMTAESKAMKVIRVATRDMQKVLKDLIKLKQDLGPAGLEDGIVPIIDIFQHQKNVCIVMKYMQFKKQDQVFHSLDQCIQSAINERKANFMVETAKGLLYLHSKNIAHNNLKLENLLVDDEQFGKVALSDIKCSKTYKNLTSAKTGVGESQNLYYTAPENINKDELGLPSDIWTLGLIFLEIIKGKRLPSFLIGVNLAPCKNKNFPQNQLLEGFDPKMKQLLRKMFKQNPLERINIYDVVNSLPRNEGTVDSFQINKKKEEFKEQDLKKNAFKKKEQQKLIEKEKVQEMKIDEFNKTKASVSVNNRQIDLLIPLFKEQRQMMQRQPQNYKNFIRDKILSNQFDRQVLNQDNTELKYQAGQYEIQILYYLQDNSMMINVRADHILFASIEYYDKDLTEQLKYVVGTAEGLFRLIYKKIINQEKIFITETGKLSITYKAEGKEMEIGNTYELPQQNMKSPHKYPQFSLPQELGRVPFKNQQSLSGISIQEQEGIIQIMKETQGEFTKEIADSYEVLAIQYHEIGYHEKAIFNHERALEAYEKSIGKNNVRIATLYHNLGNAYQDAHKYQKSIGLYKNALEIRKNLNNEDVVGTAMTYNSLGSAYASVHNTKQALEYYNKSVKLLENIGGQPNQYLASTLNNIANIYSNSNSQSKKAIELYERSILIYQEQNQSTDQIIRTLNNLSSIYFKNRMFQKGIQTFSRAFEICQKYGKEENPSIYQIQQHIPKNISLILYAPNVTKAVLRQTIDLIARYLPSFDNYKVKLEEKLKATSN